MQLIPWAALTILAAGVLILLGRPTARRVVTVRVAALVVSVASLYGVYEHVAANYQAGPLDATYAARWDSMSTLSQWWTAATEGVGPVPSIAPGVLAYAALCLWLATLRHPLLVRRER